MKKTLIWLDDIRNPQDAIWQTWIKIHFGRSTLNEDIIWVKSYKEFTKYVVQNGLPDYISFDHDLGDIDNPDGEKTGYDCAQYIVDYCLDAELDIPNYQIQSDNGPGRENIDRYMKNYHEFYINNILKEY